MQEQPNIVVIMTDQQRGDALSINSHPCLMTPNIDNLARRGTQFKKAYTTCPSCISSRRSFMSGQYPATHGLVGYQDGLEWDPPTTLPQALKEAGYQTGIVGRHMHLHPYHKRYGFDNMITLSHEKANNPYGYDAWLKKHFPDVDCGLYDGGVMHNDSTAKAWHLDEAYHQSNWTVGEAKKFLETHDPSCPFFLVVSFLAPHPPLIPPEFYLRKYLDMDLDEPVIGDWAIPPEELELAHDVSDTHQRLEGEALRFAKAGYYGLINHVDDQIRRLLNPISGIDAHTDRETILVFTSDHGEMLGDHYRWRKSVAYEASANIPLIIKTPKSYDFPKNLQCNEPVSHEDVMPTLLDLVDISIPDSVEGKSLVPYLKGDSTPLREYLHLEHAPIHQSLTDGKEKYIWHPTNGLEQFFDLDKDPRECVDLALDPSESDRIDVWRERLVHKLAPRAEGFSDGRSLISGKAYSAKIA